MDTGTGKAIELILIVAVVLGFYLQQRKALDRARNRERTVEQERTRTPEDKEHEDTKTT
ncbi:hypothetical protein ThidrDRAFT_3761 [Thiorhodococcus drewsii AZ1]|uniref:Uncharacterized protein n=1 Tax=Thiorhodococcus drewsii AZ1 TaxID=765913 RepID=G2E648_9GAMM|nr:hypothetical protein [Thiorhodococcus drewsii]EGV28465.1 hypothetical protein ThidrDRAFT_3761 [Thiorhodococcus drewsii AZ1]